MKAIIVFIGFLAICTRPVHGAPVDLVRLDDSGSPVLNIERSALPDESDLSLSFLTKYGYLPTKPDGKSYLIDEKGVSEAIKKVQKFGGLNESGVLDQETVELMKTPRCGVPDVIEGYQNLVDLGDDEVGDIDEESEESDIEAYYPSRRRKRYALQGSRWKKKTLTYKVGKYPTNLTRSQVDRDVRKAFNMWSQASGLKFVSKKFGSVDIEIRFENYYHGDEDAFDGPGGVVAHAFFPEFGGDAHFDNGENWTVDKYSGVSLLQSIAHELGHSLGLLHSNNYRAMMSPYHKGWRPGLALDSDDIKAAKVLYGHLTTGKNSAVKSKPIKKPRNYYYRY